MLDRVQPGRRRRDPAHRRHRACCSTSEPCTAARSRRPLRHRQEARLPAGHRRARARARRPRPGVPRRSSPTSLERERRLRVIPLAEARALRPRGAAAPLPPTAVPLGRRARAASPPSRSSPPRTCRRSPTPRWTATRCGPPTPRRVAATPVRLEVVGTLAAGAAPDDRRSAPGEAMRIMTGAPMPAGADAVVMVEDTEAADDGARCASTRRSRPATHVRARRRRRRAGRRGVRRRAPCSARRTSACWPASASPTCRCRRRPRVGVLSTGDELVEGGGPLAPGQIRESNRPMLLALVAQAGCDAGRPRPRRATTRPRSPTAVERGARRRATRSSRAAG